MSDPSATDRRAIQTDQLAKLRALIAELIPGNRFYTARFKQAGVTPDIESLEAFSERMPFTTKQDLVDDQQANPPYGSTLTYPIERYTRFHQTSGTTRSPIRWLDTNEGWDWMLGNWGCVYDAAGVGPGDRVMFTFSFGPFLGFWTAFECATKRGCLCLPGGGLSTEARLRMILANDATVLCCTPTYALRLVEVAAQSGIDLSTAKVRRVIVAGEPGGSIPATRQRIEQAWPNAKVIDHHGMTEIGPVSYQNPDRADVLHIIESSYYAEVIDPATGKAAPPGETGELVLTTLGRAGSPLLRYSTGDLVKPSVEPIPALGRADLALLGGILGRADDMVVVRSVNVYPSAVEEVVRGHADVAEYRVEVRQVRAMTELKLLVEPSPDCADVAALVEQLETDLRGSLSLRIAVEIVARDALPRFEMKAKRWVRVE